MSDLLEGLQGLGFSQGEVEERIHELSAAEIQKIVFVCSFALTSHTQCFQDDFLQVPRIVVSARCEGIQSACQTIWYGIAGEIIIICEYNVESSVQLFCCKVTEMLGDK